MNPSAPASPAAQSSEQERSDRFLLAAFRAVAQELRWVTDDGKAISNEEFLVAHAARLARLLMKVRL